MNMKRAISALIILCAAASVACTGMRAETGGLWKTYLAYHDITEIQPAEDIIYVLASGNLYSYSTGDNSITTYDKISPLSDCGIMHIAYCKSAGRLLILYDNGNIDLLDGKGEVTNIPDYYNKSMTEDKTIIRINVYGNNAYLSTNFGIVKVNIRDAEISDTYNLGLKVTSTAVTETHIYAATHGGIYRAPFSSNLLDKNNWVKYNSAGFSNLFNLNGTLIGINSGEAYTVSQDESKINLFYTPYFTNATMYGDKIVCYGGDHSYIIGGPTDCHDIAMRYKALAYDSKKKCYWSHNSDNALVSLEITDDDKVDGVSSGVKPDGPKYNHFNYLYFKNNRLYTSGGGWRLGSEYFRPGCVQTLKDGKWNVWQDDFKLPHNDNYQDAAAIAVDPADPEHIFVGNIHCGVIEMKEGKFVNNYTFDNSPIQSIFETNPNYVRVDGLVFDRKGSLFMLNSQSKNSLIEYTADKKWVTHNNPALYDDNGKSLGILRRSMTDSRGLIWFVNDHSTKPSVFCYDPDNDKLAVFNTLVNQNGSKLDVYGFKYIVEDINNDIWVGTNIGPLVITKEIMSDTGLGFKQVVVPRNDGSNYGDYLLNNVYTTSIAIDGGNRKWFGTNGNGAYLISSDNNTQIYHFTSSNSPLLSNDIEDIAIDNSTGEVFFGTNKGLCSYMSRVTAPNTDMTKDNVYAYPNPVKPGYTGDITITGLSFDADVKITTSNGVLVAQGKSTGGSFVWDGCDTGGKSVASGIYMVQTATVAGGKGTVCKIAIIR